jgi:GDPmannose 4,6-dehydratase
MYLILQQDVAEDFVIATGITTEIREFVKMAFNEVGIIVEFNGINENEVAIVVQCNGAYQLPEGTTVVKVDPRYYRPTEVELLIGDATKAREKLGWQPKYTLQELVKEMVAADVDCFKKEVILKQSGFSVKNQFE